jgi:hypothetical protein
MGGQLIPNRYLAQLKSDIIKGKLNSWSEIHGEYQKMHENYLFEKTCFAMHSLEMIMHTKVSPGLITSLIPQVLKIAEYVKVQTAKTRLKDYRSTSRKMMYETESEMYSVLGDPDDNSFLLISETKFEEFKSAIQKLVSI